jgi:myo-inositol 2-dehydrogenase / D-chiro-inositol 1-dehydrogenase
MVDKQSDSLGRRGFLKTAAVASAGISIVPASAVRGSTANSKIELGLIGCGGRGVWLARLFEEHGNYKITSVHDYFEDQAERAGEQFKVGKDNQHVDLDGYKAMLAGDVDAVAIISPPYFHPQQSLDAIDAGKHVYLAKPVAVDVPGCNKILEGGRRAADKLSYWVDFQTRMDPMFQGAAKRVHEKLVGAPVCGQTFYHTGRLKEKVPDGDDTTRLRNWYFDIALSGDIIVEQNVHVLDVMNWYLQGHPEKAVGYGGRKARTHMGDCMDHFVMTYTYPGDTLVDFGSSQFLYGYHDMCMRLFCQEGTVESHYGGEVWIRGNKTGWKGGETPKIYQEGAVANIKAFEAAISSGKTINNAEECVNSTLTGVLGRMAAKEKREVTWQEMMAANEALDAKLNLPADGPKRRRR